MSEKYDEKERALVPILLNRMFIKANRMGSTYRQLAPMVRAKSHVTIWRWKSKVSMPSRHHIYWIKKFLGYSLA